MDRLVSLAIAAVALGIGATAILDLWALYAAKAFRSRGLDMAMLGRWLGHLSRGRFHHDNIAAAAPVTGERVLGWAAHYAIGVVFAGVFLMIIGMDWTMRPTPFPALGFGVLTVAVPLFVLQPLIGAGVAASKTPDPSAARLRSLGSHLVFGLGLYLSALAWAAASRAVSA